MANPRPISRGYKNVIIRTCPECGTVIMGHNVQNAKNGLQWHRKKKHGVVTP